MVNSTIKKEKIWTKDNTTFMLLFLMAIFVVYFAPFIVNQIYFIIIIFLAYRSKKDYFWIAFVFLLIDAPGRLFRGGLRTDTNRLAIYSLASGITIKFIELFLIGYFLKAFHSGKKYVFIFKNDLKFLLIFVIFVLIYSLPLGLSIVKTFRLLLPWSFLYFIPKFLTTEEDFKKISRLLFPIVFFALISQIYNYLTGTYLGYFLKGDVIKRNYYLVTEDSEHASRAIASTAILLYCFFQSLFYLAAKKRIFSSFYLYSILFISTFSIFITATRTWIIAFSFILLGSTFLVKQKKMVKNYVGMAVTGFVIIVILMEFYPLIAIQVENTIDRVSTIKALAQGDVTADGTLKRLNVRAPRVMNEFKKNPILGWGFSSHYFRYADGHIGHHNILLNVGVIGYIILNFFFFKWFYNIYFLSRYPQIRGEYGKAVLICALTLIGIYLIHTATQFWGFHIGATRVLFIALLFGFVNAIYLKGVENENDNPLRRYGNPPS